MQDAKEMGLAGAVEPTFCRWRALAGRRRAGERGSASERWIQLSDYGRGTSLSELLPAESEVGGTAGVSSDPETVPLRPGRMVVGCKAGGRSARAWQILAFEGFQNLRNMDGGFVAHTDPLG